MQRHSYLVDTDSKQKVDCKVEMESPSELRARCRDGSFSAPTPGCCPGFAQANLAILPQRYAFDFLLFCQRNPKPCPLLEVLEPGVYLTTTSANSADIRTDLPKYKVFRDGQLQEELTDITHLWQEDFVTFVIGCSFSFEEALQNAGLAVRHIDEQVNVPMYRTNIACQDAGCFSSNMVVSMRPFSPAEAVKAVEITSRYPRVHGAPVHIGSPEQIGIVDISKPDYGDPVTIREGEIPVFWACGVTPQEAVLKSKPALCITHAPGHMLMLDIRNDELSLS